MHLLTEKYDDNGELHSDTGPAQTFSDGSFYYYKHGKRHREDGPAYYEADDNKFHYYLNDVEYTVEEFTSIISDKKGA